MQGPDLTNSQVGVLIRFRRDHVAFMADIEALFHQVQVPDEQCDFLRFLWWPDANLEEAIQEYQMTVHLFVAVSSPGCLILPWNKWPKDMESQKKSVVPETIRRNCGRSSSFGQGWTNYHWTDLRSLPSICAEGLTWPSLYATAVLIWNAFRQRGAQRNSEILTWIRTVYLLNVPSGYNGALNMMCLNFA